MIVRGPMDGHDTVVQMAVAGAPLRPTIGPWRRKTPRLPRRGAGVVRANASERGGALMCANHAAQVRTKQERGVECLVGSWSLGPVVCGYVEGVQCTPYGESHLPLAYNHSAHRTCYCDSGLRAPASAGTYPPQALSSRNRALPSTCRPRLTRSGNSLARWQGTNVRWLRRLSLNASQLRKRSQSATTWVGR